MNTINRSLDIAVPTNARKWGWKRDLPDHRDYKLPEIIFRSSLPASVDLRSVCPPVYDQEKESSCTAQAIAGAIQFDQIVQNIPSFIPSRNFIYYCERDIEGTTDSDSGASIRDGMKAINQWGYCSEEKWPYLEANVLLKPPVEIYTNASIDDTYAYSAVSQTLVGLKQCLASGRPFIFGFSAYDSFLSPQTAATGVVLMPQQSEGLVGGHAVLCVGYNDQSQQWIVRNSWGPDWGVEGYCVFPYQYLLNPGLASDFWMIQSVVG